MRPASRRALLERLAAAAPSRGALTWPAIALGAALVFVLVYWLQRPAAPPAVAPPPPPHSAPSLLDPALALPFGEGSATVAAATPERGPQGAIEELRAIYRAAPDRRALYAQWRNRPEADARYLAYRAARDCDLLLAGAAAAQLEGPGERAGERAGDRERRMAESAGRCQGFTVEPAAPEETEHLLEEAASAGHPAALVALAAEKYAQTPLAETVSVLRQALASGDPFAYDEARIVLAMARHQIEIAGMAPRSVAANQRADARVAAIDLAGCLLGNPCGPSRGVVVLECSDDYCRRDAQDWLLQMSNLGDDDRRLARALAERLASAFRRGAVDEILRAPSLARTAPR